MLYLFTPRRLPLVVLVSLLTLLYLAPFALADSGAPPSGPFLLFGTIPVWTAVAGFVSVGASYVVNHFAFWGSEQAKALFLLIATTVAGALTQLIQLGTVSWNSYTLDYVLGTLLFALALHYGILKPSSINTLLGAGANHNGDPATVRVGLGSPDAPVVQAKTQTINLTIPSGHVDPQAILAAVQARGDMPDDPAPSTPDTPSPMVSQS